jgi:hypothetical protein
VTVRLVDRRCVLCEEDATGTYRMIGDCRNCKYGPILGLFSVGHRASGGKCPVCGCERLYWDRLVTANEMPAGFEVTSSSEGEER